jgi:hypothetical protein
MARIALDHVEKVGGGGVMALDDLNLEVKEGEFMVLGESIGHPLAAGVTAAGSRNNFIGTRWATRQGFQ